MRLINRGLSALRVVHQEVVDPELGLAAVALRVVDPAQVVGASAVLRLVHEVVPQVSLALLTRLVRILLQ